MYVATIQSFKNMQVPAFKPAKNMHLWYDNDERSRRKVAVMLH